MISTLNDKTYFVRRHVLHDCGYVKGTLLGYETSTTQEMKIQEAITMTRYYKAKPQIQTRTHLV